MWTRVVPPAVASRGVLGCLEGIGGRLGRVCNCSTKKKKSDAPGNALRVNDLRSTRSVEEYVDTGGSGKAAKRSKMVTKE